jgi:uncharacterized membrane protein YdbT with pleckstrin-like domain
MINLQSKEKILHQDNPDKSMLVFWFFKSMALSLILFWPLTMFGSILLVPLKSFIGVGFMLLFFFLAFTILFVITFLYHVYLRKTYEYYITNQRVVFKGGILLKRLRSVPYHKITDVEVSQNIIEQFLNLSTLRLHTAGMGTAMAEIRFIGIKDASTPEKAITRELNKFKSKTAE